ncbi:hypothetical protein AB6A40_005485 [Gnathostoma spinigerum]|uniref:Phosphotransferase n=1 Tax=Gnathostoma spinigerum TaxID=75299 RepID=A0ABD6EMW9_9BILA
MASFLKVTLVTEILNKIPTASMHEKVRSVENRRRPSLLERLKTLSVRGNDPEQEERIEELCKCLYVSNEQLRKMMSVLLSQMEKGLSLEGASTASIKMLPSYVRAIPNGTERGDFLALDLGGTNFRVLLITLEGRDAKMCGKIYRVPDSIMKGSGTALFDRIAECLAEFVKEQGLSDGRKLPLGFTFSFPCKQEGLTAAKLIHWTKGFKASGVENHDVVTLLREACARRKVNHLLDATLNK